MLRARPALARLHGHDLSRHDTPQPGGAQGDILLPLRHAVTRGRSLEAANDQVEGGVVGVT